MSLESFIATKMETPSCDIGELCEVCDRQFRKPATISREICLAPGPSPQPIYTMQLSMEEASAKSNKMIQKIENTRKVLQSAITVCQFHLQSGRTQLTDSSQSHGDTILDRWRDMSAR